MRPCPFAVDVAEQLSQGLDLHSEEALTAYKVIIAAACQTALSHAASRIMDREFAKGSKMCMDSTEVSDHVLGVIAMDILRMKSQT